MKKCISLAGHFDGHVDQSIQCRVHRSLLGYPRYHRTLPLGKYSPCIALVDTMVIDFGVKIDCGVLKLFSKASVKKAQNKPATQLVEVTSCIERLNATIEAKELS